MSLSTPPQKLPKDKGRPCLNVKNRSLFQCSHVLQKHAYSCLEPEARTHQEKQSCVGMGQIHGSWCNSLCKAERVKGICVILPKFLSGISGGPRVSDLITPRPPSTSEVFQLEGPAMGR